MHVFPRNCLTRYSTDRMLFKNYINDSPLFLSIIKNIDRSCCKRLFFWPSVYVMIALATVKYFRT